MPEPAYGDANPALTYQVGGSASSTATPVGRAGDIGDTASNVGTYGIGQGTLRLGNYALNYTGDNLTVQRAITVTADAKSRAYGDANPALTYQVGGTGTSSTATRCRVRWRHRRQRQQCRHLRDQRKGKRCASLGQLRAELYGRQPDGHPARDHGDGRCQEPRLWRCQSGADLSGRRLGPRQWRHAVGCAGDVSDNSQQCRHSTASRRARWPPRATTH